MGLNQLDIISRSAKSAVANQIARETPKIYSSLVAEMRTLVKPGEQKGSAALHQAEQGPIAFTPERLAEDAENKTQTAQPPMPLADGYIRRTPEQTLYTPPDYYSSRLKKGLLTVLTVMVCVLALLLVYYFGFRK